MKNKIILFLCMLLVFVGAPYLVNYIVLTPSPVGFITPDKQETWINFYGTMVGGILTLLGVGWTIEHTNFTRKEDQKNHEAEIKKEYEKRDLEIKKNLSVQYKPILTIAFDSDYLDDKPFGVSTYKGYYIQNHICLVDKIIEQEKRLAISLYILNIGRGEARELKIYSSVISADGEEWETRTRNYNEICTSNGININFYRILNEKEWEQYDDKILVQPVTVCVQIDYIDLVGYQHSLKSCIKIKKFVHMKKENDEKITDVIVMNPYDSIIQNITSDEEGEDDKFFIKG